MRYVPLVAAMALASISFADAPKTFKIGAGRASQQIATVESVTEFETFVGRTSKVTGMVRFDPSQKTGSGMIEIDASSISTGIDLRDEHMRSPMWLDTNKYKTIKFETTKVEHTSGNKYKVTGKFTMHGVTKTITATTTVKYRPESEATKTAGFNGDVLQVVTNFSVKLSDYGIQIPGPAQGKVSNKVDISVTAYGQTGS